MYGGVPAPPLKVLPECGTPFKVRENLPTFAKPHDLHLPWHIWVSTMRDTIYLGEEHEGPSFACQCSASVEHNTKDTDAVHNGLTINALMIGKLSNRKTQNRSRYKNHDNRYMIIHLATTN
ncbi:hypothetical protein BO83DRAFT_389591 [Aspergillus eucalypticola CBS 122712]|uniref:Uncharacterized protein n=1 Tax=Aspergillus eucalypticola (strain CBS 122712 / IBT 29274) TaxID=1448314 RepID=A0A317VAQ1_ASPEC|nr:uncharacterized protein BO83DRAFT_389591 [Aspergillus eucalypticola CBS 122712]PWY71286.1 hypothetical protein BO83DRAFT_389591 [Aspergillus eucalypticola CBS 122712]